MKKLFLIFGILLHCSLVWGQLSNETPKPILKANLTYPTKELTLDITNGISIPFGNFSNIAHEGFNTGIILNRKYSSNLSLSAGINYSAFDYKSKYGSFLNENHQYINTSFDIGPQYTLFWKHFSLNFYGRTGLSYLQAPTAVAYYPNSEIITSNLNKQNTTAFTARFGSDFSAQISRGLQLFISTEYVRTFNNELNYQYRDVSTAINADGTLDHAKANEIIFNNEGFSFSGFNINLGININIGNSAPKSNYKENMHIFYDNSSAGINPIYESMKRITRDSLSVDSVILEK